MDRRTKTILLTVSCAMALLLGGCGKENDGDQEPQVPVEALTQTTELADYSAYVTLGQYTDLNISVEEVEVTEEDLQNSKSEMVELYNALSGTTGLTWGDELAAAMSQGEYTTADAYEKFLYQSLEDAAARVQRQAYAEGLWEAVRAGSSFTELPADVIQETAESYYANQRSAYETYASYYGYTYEQFLEEMVGVTDEELHEQAYESARGEQERIYLAVSIYRDLGLEFSDEEFSRGVAALTEQYNYTGSSGEFVERYGEEYVREVLITLAVEEYLIEHNNMEVRSN